MKSIQIRSFFWSVFSRIQSECAKIQTRKNSVFGYFSRSLRVYVHYNAFQYSFHYFFSFLKIFCRWSERKSYLTHQHHQCQFRTLSTSKMERFPKILTGFKLLPVFTKRSILDVLQGSEYATEIFTLSQTLENKWLLNL